MYVSFLKKNCSAEREGKKKKSGKLFCGNGIAEIEGEWHCLNRGGEKKQKQFATFFFFPSLSALQFFFRNDTYTIFSQHFYNKS